MSNTKSKNSSSKSSSVAPKEYTAKAGKNSARGTARKPSTRPVSASTHQESSTTGFYAGFHAERKAKARATYIADLSKTVEQARLLSAELVQGEQATYIVEYMIAKYYSMSVESGRNFAAPFVDVRNQTLEELADYDVTTGFLRYATNQAFNALSGGYVMMKYGQDFDTALATIKRRYQQSQQKRVSQLVGA